MDLPDSASVVNEIIRQRHELIARGRSTVFVVMDAETFLTVAEQFADNINVGYGATIANCTVVVMPTDGIPMLKVLSDPVTEATRPR